MPWTCEHDHTCLACLRTMQVRVVARHRHILSVTHAFCCVETSFSARILLSRSIARRILPTPAWNSLGHAVFHSYITAEINSQRRRSSRFSNSVDRKGAYHIRLVFLLYVFMLGVLHFVSSHPSPCALLFPTLTYVRTSANC